jgi:hypothetical protein
MQSAKSGRQKDTKGVERCIEVLTCPFAKAAAVGVGLGVGRVAVGRGLVVVAGATGREGALRRLMSVRVIRVAREIRFIKGYQVY